MTRTLCIIAFLLLATVVHARTARHCHTVINGKSHPEICLDCSRGHWPNVEQVPCSKRDRAALANLLKGNGK